MTNRSAAVVPTSKSISRRRFRILRETTLHPAVDNRIAQHRDAWSRGTIRVRDHAEAQGAMADALAGSSRMISQ